MNILFLSTENPYPPDHGHHIRTFNILKGLAKHHNIFFIGFAKNKSELIYSKHLYEYCSTVDILLINKELSKWRLLISVLLNIFSPLPYTVSRYYKKEAKQKIKQIIKHNGIDLVHCDMLHLGVYLNEIRSSPKIIVNHNVESLRMLRWFKTEKNIFVKFFLYFQYQKLYHFEKRICPQFDKCVVVSDFDKKILLNMCKKDNFVVIPNGVDSRFFRPDYTEEIPKSLVWTGEMSGPYNREATDYFIDEIFPLVQSQIPDVKVYFVGKSPTSKLIKKAQRNPNIKIEGYVDDVRPYIGIATAFIAPHRSGSGTKIKILNALSQAKAVVTTSIGAEGIEVTNNENIIIANEPDQFAEKIIYLLNNPNIAKEIGQKGRKLIEKKYDWKIIEKNMNEIYNRVAKSSDHLYQSAEYN